MSQSRRTYGRRPQPTENTRNFMSGLKETAEQHKRNLEADRGTSDSEPVAKKARIQPFKVPSKPTAAGPQKSKRKRARALEDDNLTDQPRSKKQLPSPPADPKSAANNPPLQGLSKGQRKRLRKKQEKIQDQLAMQNTIQQRPLPSPPPSATGLGEATTSPEPSPAQTAIIPLELPTDNNTVNTDDEPHVPMTSTPLSISANGGPIEGLSTELLEIILGYALPPTTKRHIKPFYMKGMMRHGIRSEPYNDEGVIDNDNIDLSVLRVSRAFHQIGTELFYGRNTFSFKDADACS